MNHISINDRAVTTQLSHIATVEKLALVSAPGSFGARLAVDFNAALTRYGSLTPKQFALAEKLIGEIEVRAAADGAVAPRESFPGIRALFAKAGEALKNPKVRFGTEDGTGIVLHLAGKQSKSPGAIHVTGEGSFGDRPYFGKIALDGGFTSGHNLTDGVRVALRALDANPAQAAAAYGQRTGCCSFCSRELADGRSVSVGYGPICAEKFGLPWGVE